MANVTDLLIFSNMFHLLSIIHCIQGKNKWSVFALVIKHIPLMLPTQCETLTYTYAYSGLEIGGCRGGPGSEFHLGRI